MRKPMNRTIAWTTVAILSLGSLTGCSRAPLMAAADSGIMTDAQRDGAPTPTGVISGTDTTVINPVPAPRPGSGENVVWTEVNATPVRAGTDQRILCGRYSLMFAKGSLEKDELITVKEYDPNVLDMQFGPHGTQFRTPVELTIDFSGTAADPGTIRDPDLEPVLWYLDESQNRWVIIPSVIDWDRKVLIARLEHFSRYAVGGKAGWKHQPHTESDGQE